MAKSRSQMDLLFGKKSFTGKIIIWEKMFHRWIVYLEEINSQMKSFCVIDSNLSELFHYKQNKLHHCLMFNHFTCQGKPRTIAYTGEICKAETKEKEKTQNRF